MASFKNFFLFIVLFLIFPSVILASEKPSLDIEASTLSFEELKNKLAAYSLTAEFKGTEEEIVLCLESIPRKFEAQRAIYELLEAVSSVEGKKLLTPILASEEKALDLQECFILPDLEISKLLAKYWLKKNIITGVEHFFIYHEDYKLIPLEDAASDKELLTSWYEIVNTKETTILQLKKFKQWAEDIEAYLILETNLPSFRKSLLAEKFKEYYQIIAFIKKYISLECMPDELFLYNQKKYSFSLPRIIEDLDTLLKSLNISMDISFNLKPIAQVIRQTEVFYENIFDNKISIVSQLVSIMKNQKQKYAILVIDSLYREFILKELERRGISHLLFSPIDIKRQSSFNPEHLFFPEKSRIEKIVEELVISWISKEDVAFQDTFRKRNKFMIRVVNLFFYNFLKINKLKEELKDNLSRVNNLIEKEFTEAFSMIKEISKRDLEESIMKQGRKDFLTIQEMNKVNLEVSRKVKQLRYIQEKIRIDLTKIMISEKKQLRIPFALHFKNKEEALLMFIGEDIYVKVADLKSLVEKENFNDNLGYKIIQNTGVGLEMDYQLIEKMYGDQKSIKKLDKTLDKIKEDVRIKEGELALSKEEKEILLLSTRELSHKVAEQYTKSLTYAFDKVYEKGREEVLKVFKIYDRLGFTDKDILNLAQTVASKVRDTFVFYLSSGVRVELNKEVARRYVAHRFGSLVPDSIINLIFSIDMAISKVDERLLRFQKQVLKKEIDAVEDIEQIQKVFYLTLFFEPFFKQSKVYLTQKESKRDLFYHVKTRLILLDFILNNAHLTVKQVQEFIGFIVDGFLHLWKELKKKEHREIFEHEREKLLELEKILILSVNLQLKLNRFKEYFSEDIEERTFKEIERIFLQENEVKEEDYLKALVEVNPGEEVKVDIPSCKLWKRVVLKKESLIDFIRYYLKSPQLFKKDEVQEEFDTLFEPEILAKLWYSNLEKTDILSRLSQELIVRKRDLKKLSDDMYILESPSITSRFLVRYGKENKIDKIFIERLAEKSQQSVFIEFDTLFMDNPFDRRVLEEIKDRFRFVIQDIESLKNVTRTESRLMVLRPLCHTSKALSEAKSIVNCHPLVKYLMLKCRKLEKNSERKLSLGSMIYILKPFLKPEDKITKLFYIPSNSFFQSEDEEKTAVIVHEAFHYIFYNMREDIDLIRNLYYFFKDKNHEKFFRDVQQIRGLDIKLDEEFYFKTQLVDVVNFRKVEEFIAVVLENLALENEKMVFSLKDSKVLELPIYTKDVETLSLLEFLPYWMSPQRLGYHEKFITRDYYDLVFNKNMDILFNKADLEEITWFLKYYYGRETLIPDTRRLKLAEGLFAVGNLRQGNKEIFTFVTNRLEVMQIEEKITKEENDIFKFLLFNSIEKLTGKQKFELANTVNSKILSLQKYFLSLELDNRENLAYKFLVAYYLTNNFSLPKEDLLTFISDDLRIVLSRVADKKVFFKCIGLNKLFDYKKVEEITLLVEQYLVSERLIELSLDLFAVLKKKSSCVNLVLRYRRFYLKPVIKKLFILFFSRIKYPHLEAFLKENMFFSFINFHKAYSTAEK